MVDFGIQLAAPSAEGMGDRHAYYRDLLSRGQGALSSAWVSDHLMKDDRPILEGWTTLAYLAAEFPGLTFGNTVLSQSYRNPALLAKIAAGVDHLSGGRLEFGIGAGWKEAEYRAYGYEFPAPAVRVDELVDTIEICTRMWTDEKASYAGKRYRITDALCAPKPVQAPLPIWIGGSKPRIFRIAAMYGHWVNHTAGDMTPDGVRVRQEALDIACRDRKRDPRTLKRSAFLSLVVGATARDVDALVADAARQAKLTPDQWRAARPSAIVGTPAEAIRRLREYAKIGIDHVNALFPYTHEREVVDLLGRETLGALA